MAEVLLSEFIEFNPKVKLSKGIVAPFVPMDSVIPWYRDVVSAESKPYSGGAKFLDGDVLLARITPSLENGKTSIYRASESAKSEPAFGSTEFIVARGIEGISDTEYIYYLLRTDKIRSVAIASMTGSSGRQRVQLDKLGSTLWDLPPLVQQRQIVAILSALDDKISSNMKQRALCRELGSALVARQVEHITNYLSLGDFCLSISRGVTPKYFKNEDIEPVKVLNQKCIRGGWVSPKLARWMIPRRTAKVAAIAEYGDLLVNSTGQGTLGRVGRWSFEESIYVDSHVSVVKPNPEKLSPTLLNYLVFPKQSEIEEMAEGSTGQTELSPTRLASLEIPEIPRSEQEKLEPLLLALEKQAHSCFVQASKLAALRDSLLPELMSGRISASEAADLIDLEVAR